MHPEPWIEKFRQPFHALFFTLPSWAHQVRLIAYSQGKKNAFIDAPRLPGTLGRLPRNSLAAPSSGDRCS